MPSAGYTSVNLGRFLLIKIPIIIGGLYILLAIMRQ